MVVLSLSVPLKSQRCLVSVTRVVGASQLLVYILRCNAVEHGRRRIGRSDKGLQASMELIVIVRSFVRGSERFAGQIERRK